MDRRHVEKMNLGTRKSQALLQRRHVIEGMVQLLTNGFVLQLLSVELIWMGGKYRRVSRRAEPEKSRARGRQAGRRRKEKTEGGGKKKEVSKKNMKDGMTECLPFSQQKYSMDIWKGLTQ